MTGAHFRNFIERRSASLRNLLRGYLAINSSAFSTRARLPLDARIRELTDSGNPTVIGDPESAAALAYRDAARRTAATLAAQGRDYSARFPNIVVEDS